MSGSGLKIGDCIVELVDDEGLICFVRVGPSGEGEAVTEHRECAKIFSEVEAVAAARWFGNAAEVEARRYCTENGSFRPSLVQVVKRIG